MGAHELIKSNWDESLTLQQNYKRLGLVTKVNGVAGGQGLEANAAYAQIRAELAEKTLSVPVEWRTLDEESPSPITTEISEEKEDLDEQEGLDVPKFIDDRVTSIGQKVSLKKVRNVRLDQKLASSQSSSAEMTETQKEGEPGLLKTQIIEALEKEAKEQVRVLRATSDHEDLFLELLQNKHGDDYERMARDVKLNKFLFTAGQLKKKFSRWALKRSGVKRVLL